MAIQPKVSERIFTVPYLQPRSFVYPNVSPGSGGVIVASITIVEYAAACANGRMICLLFDMGLIRTKDDKLSALESSVVQGNLDTARCLLELGANPNVLNRNGVSPFGYAIM